MHKRRRWLIAGSAVLVFLVAIAGTAFYFTGGYEKWRDERSLAGACEGVLSKDDVRAALGSDRVHAQSGEKLNYIFSNLEKDRITKCVLESRGSGENVVINAAGRQGTPTSGGTTRICSSTKAGMAPCR
ncbi:hypothetical protein ACFQ2B_08925 [Streptomyces stramineus]